MAPGQKGARPGEFDAIARYFAPLATTNGAFGLLDDAAMIRPEPGQDLVLTKDSLAAGVHFFADDPPASIARKVLRVNLSDLAAKGADPAWYLLSLALPVDWSEDWLAEFCKGLASDQEKFGIALLGGDTLKSPGGLVVSVTAIGTAPEGSMITRLTGQSGDMLYVTGTIGDGYFGLKIHGDGEATGDWPLDTGDRDFLRRRYLEPDPRSGMAPLLRRHASAAMDVSDGLLGDLEKLCRASGVGAVLQRDCIPHSRPVSRLIDDLPVRWEAALNGGDDYEVLCAVPPRAAALFEEEARALDMAVTQIGELTKFARGVSVVDDGGETIPVTSGGFAHF